MKPIADIRFGTTSQGFLCSRCGHLYHNRKGDEPTDAKCSRCGNHTSGTISSCLMVSLTCQCGFTWCPKQHVWDRSRLKCPHCKRERPLYEEERQQFYEIIIDGERRTAEGLKPPAV